MTENTYDTIIVGGGIAGLTATAYLAKEGKKVLLIEKNRELGGLVNSFSRNGFHFEAGVRALEDAGIIFPMLKGLGIELEVVKSKVSVGIENEIIHVEDLESLIEYKAMLKKLYPENQKEIDQLLKTIKKVMKHMDVLYGIENPLFKDLKRDFRYIFKKLLPWMPRFLFTVGKINRMQLPVEEYLDRTICNNSLRDIVAQHFFKNTPTFFALSYFSLYLDYFYPKGGVGKIAEAVSEKILEFGGEIKTETMVNEVLADKNIVTDHKNNQYKYKKLIWAADLKAFYNITNTGNLPHAVKTNYEKVKTKILANKGGESVFTLYLQVDEPLETFEKIANGHFFYTPSRQGLGQTHRKELDDLLKNFDKTSKSEILKWLDKFTSLNTYEISIPGLKDSTLVPARKTGMIISLLTDHELFKKVKQAGWLDEFVAELENRMLKVITGSIYPVLANKVIGRFSFSPISIQNRIASSEGAIVGWAFQKEMPVMNKIQFSGRSIITPLPSVYQAGQWAYSPAGVPMSILTGKLAADRVLKSKIQNNHPRLK